MNAIPYSTSAPVAQHSPVPDPRALPEIYTIRIHLDRLAPHMRDGEMHVFSTVEPFKKGDIVALWRRPDTVNPGELQAAAYRLVNDPPADLKLGDWTNARSPDDFVIYVESTSPRERFAYRASELVAIHKWMGKLHPKQETYKLSQIEREANKEPAATTSNVPAQNELSLFAPTADDPLTMSSREIAELTEKRHADVLRDIRVMLEGLGIDERKFASVEKDAKGEARPVFRLPKEEALILVSGYNVQLRAKIVRRWMELEEAIKQPAKPAAPEFPIPQTFAEALMLAANQAAQIEHQKGAIAEKNAQIADMRGDVDALDRIAGADGLFGLRETVAMLQTTQNKFVAWLQRNGWAYRQTGSKRLLAYADKRKDGYATNKATVYEKPDGTEGVNETLKFTPVGIVKLAKALNVTLTDGDLRALHGGKGRAA